MNGKITCIDHSGFLYERDQINLIFDYYTDPRHIITPARFAGKKSYVFVSHAHADHYNPQIEKWAAFGEVSYILDAGIAPFSPSCRLVEEGACLHLGDLTVQAFGSTDIGVSFLVKLPQLTLYHAGDLNDWCWKGEMSDEACAQMEADFLAKVEAMRGIAVDVAFFPVDARLGPYAAKGVELYARQIKPGTIIPMHFFGGSSQLLLAKQALAGSGVRFIEKAFPGDVIPC